MMIKFLGLDVDANNVMVLGPPLSGKSILVRNIVYEKVLEGFGGIYVTTKDTAEDVLRTMEDVDVKVVDCVSKTIFSDAPDTENIKRVSIMDLTGISVRINAFLEEFWKSGRRDVVMVFDSVSTVLMYLNPQMVFRFLHVLTNRMKSFGAFAFYTVDEGMHDEKVVAMLKQLLSGVIELRDDGNSRFFRYISSSKRMEWRRFDIEGREVVIS